MFINIITPCSRPSNLKLIEDSINIPKENYRWIIVFDSESVPNDIYVPKYCEICSIKDHNSTVGNSQRNYGMDLVKDGYVYFLDDDTTIHPELWENIKDLNDDFIHYGQSFINGTVRLNGNNVSLYNIDTNCFVVKYDICKNIRWIIGKYTADGIFAEECYKNSKTKKFINKILSYYNTLR